VPERFVHDFKRFFLRGLAAALPTLLTVAIILYVFAAIQKYVGSYLGDAVRWLIAAVWCASAEIEPAQLPHLLQAEGWERYFWWVGFLFALVAIYIFGRFIASFIGRGLWRGVERALFRLPVIKQIYPYVKQVTDFVFSPRRVEFNRVVAVEYPRRGIWSLGLVTGPGMRTLRDETGAELLTVFIPSSPTPVTGYTIAVRRDEVVDLPISIDEALRFTVSGGVIMPLVEQSSLIETKEARQGATTTEPQKETAQ